MVQLIKKINNEQIDNSIIVQIYFLLIEMGILYLIFVAFPTLEGLTKIPKEFCQKPITDAHPVSVLMPTFRDNGLCAYGLLYYLLKKQKQLPAGVLQGEEVQVSLLAVFFQS